MPAYRYTGLTGWDYPESKDSRGVWVQDVEPGDERDLDEPIDDRWVLADERATEDPALPRRTRKAATGTTSADQPGAEPGTATGTQEG